MNYNSDIEAAVNVEMRMWYFDILCKIIERPKGNGHNNL